MRRLLLSVIVLSLLPSIGSAGPNKFHTKYQVVELNQKLHGCVIDFTNNHRVDRRFWSEALCQKRDMYVYLPPGYAPDERYPLMIWLHGFIQDEKKFLDLIVVFDREIAAGRLPPMIIASPDGSIAGRVSLLNGGSFYLNSRAGRFEDYLIVDVWNLIVTNFPIRPEPEAHVLNGVSMGGFSACNLGIKHRDRFKVVSGIMPPLNLRFQDCHGNYFGKFDPDCIGWTERYNPHSTIAVLFGFFHVRQRHMLDPLYGRHRHGVIRDLSRENPTEMLEAHNVKPGEMSMFVGYGDADEFNVGAQAESFTYFAAKRGIEKPTTVVIPCGKHDSETALKMLPQFVAWLAPLLKPYAPPLKLREPCLE